MRESGDRVPTARGLRGSSPLVRDLRAACLDKGLEVAPPKTKFYVYFIIVNVDRSS